MWKNKYQRESDENSQIRKKLNEITSENDELEYKYAQLENTNNKLNEKITSQHQSLIINFLYL